MKKILLALVCGAFCLNAMATETAYARLTLASAGGYNDKISIVEGTEYSDAFDNGADAEKLMSTPLSTSVFIYSTVGSKPYASVATNNLIGLKLTVQTNKVDDNYTIAFDYVSGRKLALKDNVTGTLTTIENGKSYAFTAAKNTTIADRFEIVAAVVPYEICYRYGALQITGYPSSAANVVVKDAAGAEVKNVAITDHAYQEIDLSGLAAGHYTVEANGQTLTISVQ